MKHITPLIFLSLLCTCASAQIDVQITTKPGTTDSARWEIAYSLPDGTTQTNHTAWDTLPEVVRFGWRLFHEGGRIGTTYLPGASATEEAMRSVVTTTFGITQDRDSVRAQLRLLNQDPVQADTTYDSRLIGSWQTSGLNCAFFSESITIDRVTSGTYDGASSRLFLDNFPNPSITVFAIGPNSFRLLNINGSFATLFVEIEEGVYKSEEGCVMTKIIE